MQKKEVHLVRSIAVSVLIALLLVGTVLALHDFYVLDPDTEGYSGYKARDRRIYDPFSRGRYFGAGYAREYVNYGAKGPTYRVTNTGSKSAYSATFNIDTNAVIPRGRSPKNLARYDPKIRGFNIIDEVVELLPYEPSQAQFSGFDTTPRGTARVVSLGDIYGATLSDPFPRTQIFINLINLPPLGAGYRGTPLNTGLVYEAWLVDDESEYAMSLGIFEYRSGLTAQLRFENRFLADKFDELRVSVEPYPDNDPRPGEIILSGRIGPTRTNYLAPSSYTFQRIR